MSLRITLVASAPCLTELLSDVAEGNRAAFRELYNHTNAKLYGIICRILARNDLAADVLQETYVRIWQQAGTFTPTKGTPLAWMATIARNQAIDEARRVKRLPLVAIGDNFDAPAEECDPLGSLDRSDSLRAIMNCLSKLDTEKRNLIMLAYYRGASREALSDRFGIPVPTVKTHLRRTLAHIKGCLPR